MWGSLRLAPIMQIFTIYSKYKMATGNVVHIMKVNLVKFYNSTVRKLT